MSKEGSCCSCCSCCCDFPCCAEKCCVSFLQQKWWQSLLHFYLKQRLTGLVWDCRYFRESERNARLFKDRGCSNQSYHYPQSYHCYQSIYLSTNRFPYFSFQFVWFWSTNHFPYFQFVWFWFDLIFGFMYDLYFVLNVCICILNIGFSHDLPERMLHRIKDKKF